MSTGPGARGREIGRTLAVFAGVVGMTALTLAALNQVPEMVGHNPRRVRAAADLRAVEARLGQALLVPAFFPQWLRWPPASVRYVEGPPGGVSFALASRGAGEVTLVIVQGFDAGAGASAAVPPQLLRQGTRLESAPVRVGDEAAVLARVRLPDGSEWRELAWTEQGRPVVFRFRDHEGDVLRMARSLRKERP